MTPDRFHTAKNLFLEVCELPADQRRAILERKCAGDPGLLSDVEKLLAEDADPVSFIDAPGLTAALGISGDPSEFATPTTWPTSIGGYHLVRKLGEGGMAVVFEGEQDNPRRHVALKIIRPGVITRQALRRFGYEVQILGRLHHPGIAQIYEAGSARIDNRTLPFFAMEYVEGVPINAYADQHDLGTRERLKLMVRVCAAVQHAHQKGVIHRDLKPGNILVDAAGEPKVLDFGVARETDADLQSLTMRTHEGQIIGTLAYMSPEQIFGDVRRLDTRTDIYALGVNLYELLAGRLPYDVQHRPITECMRLICETEPPSLKTANRLFRGDLDTIVRKALEKDPARRYPSAAALGQDLELFLADRPITARPPSSTYQLRKWVARHKLPAALMVVLAAVLVTSSVGMSLLYWHAAAKGRAAEQTSRFLQEMLLSIDPDFAGEEVPVRHILDDAAARIDQELGDQPAVAARVSQILGLAYQKLGHYAEAERHLRAALAIRRRLFDPVSGTIAESLRDLGDVLVDGGKYDEAQETLSAAVDVYERLSAVPPLDRAAALSSLGRVQRVRGDYREAESLFRRVLDARRRELGERHALVAESLNQLGLSLCNSGDYDQAEPLLRAALELRRELLGERHPAYISARNNLAILIYSKGDLDTAEPLLRAALEDARRLFGAEHPLAATALNNLAALLHARGDLTQAESLYRQALAIRQHTLDAAHPDVAAVQKGLAAVLADEGLPQEAEPLARQAVSVFRLRLGEKHPEFAGALGTLAAVLADERNFDEARPLAWQAVSICREQLGERHFDLAAALCVLGDTLLEAGEPRNAEPVFREALGIWDGTPAARNWRVALAEHNLGLSLLRQTQYPQAEPFLLASHEHLRALPGSHDRDLERTRASLIELYESWGCPEKADAYRKPVPP